jgi:tight adherence protein B
MTGSTLSIILITISFALLVFALVYIIISAVFADKIAAEKRLEELNKKEGDGTDIALVKHEKEKRTRGKAKEKRNKAVEKAGNVMYQELQSADIKMRPEEFLIFWILLAFVPGGLCALFVNDFMISIILVVAGTVLPIILIKSKQKSRVKKFEEQLSDGLMLACSSLKSGLSFNQAMESIAKDMDAPIATEFDVVLKEINMGYSMDEALDNLTKRIKSPYVSLMVSAVLVQRQTGGNLSQILENIAETIKKKMKLKKQLKSSTSGGKMSGIIVGVMPFLLLALFIAINPDVYKMVLTESRGHVLLYIAIGLEACAFAAIKKITTVKM